MAGGKYQGFFRSLAPVRKICYTEENKERGDAAMKKRLLALALLAALVLTCTLGAQAAGSLCFVAVNDTIPLTLPGSEAPYYSGGVLYLPYTAFNANPGGAVVSYNVDQGTFVLFNRTSRLVYDLDAGTVADENGVETPVSVSYRGGMLYIPASAAEHFGYTVSLLTSTTGESIIRFTNGTQVYDDSLFVEKAANLIAYLNEQEGKEETANNSSTQAPWEGVDPPEQPETQPAEVYLAFAGEAVSAETVALLKQYNIQAAFFLTAQQLTEHPALAREIYAAGHTVALEIPGTDITQEMADANEALRQALFMETVLALVPEGTGEGASWRLIEDPGQVSEEIWSASQVPMLLLCREDASALLERLTATQTTVLQLLETSQLP